MSGPLPSSKETSNPSESFPAAVSVTKLQKSESGWEELHSVYFDLCGQYLAHASRQSNWKDVKKEIDADRSYYEGPILGASLLARGYDRQGAIDRASQLQCLAQTYFTNSVDKEEHDSIAASAIRALSEVDDFDARRICGRGCLPGIEGSDDPGRSPIEDSVVSYIMSGVKASEKRTVQATSHSATMSEPGISAKVPDDVAFNLASALRNAPSKKRDIVYGGREDEITVLDFAAQRLQSHVAGLGGTATTRTKVRTCPLWASWEKLRTRKDNGGVSTVASAASTVVEPATTGWSKKQGSDGC